MRRNPNTYNQTPWIHQFFFILLRYIVMKNKEAVAYNHFSRTLFPTSWWLITFISLFYKRWNFRNITTFILPKLRLVRLYKNHSKQVQILQPKTLGFQVDQANIKKSYFWLWDKVASNCQNTTNKNCVTKMLHYYYHCFHPIPFFPFENWKKNVAQHDHRQWLVHPNPYLETWPLSKPNFSTILYFGQTKSSHSLHLCKMHFRELCGSHSWHLHLHRNTYSCL